MCHAADRLLGDLVSWVSWHGSKQASRCLRLPMGYGSRRVSGETALKRYHLDQVGWLRGVLWIVTYMCAVPLVVAQVKRCRRRKASAFRLLDFMRSGEWAHLSCSCTFSTRTEDQGPAVTPWDSARLQHGSTQSAGPCSLSGVRQPLYYSELSTP